MAFEVELGLEGLVDRLDSVPQRFEKGGAGAFGFTFAGEPDRRATQGRDQMQPQSPEVA
ncbi:hypothetical protein MOQ72_08085 [Saccharopolyspora sp. K220]|nr:hypothetical protein [Saccharopolyspora soli]MCI2417381.1 hypothetical protein [Saccharopolyspora soli]